MQEDLSFFRRQLKANKRKLFVSSLKKTIRFEVVFEERRLVCDIWNAEEEARKTMWYFTKRYVRVCFVTFHFAAKKVQEDPEVRRHCLWHAFEE